MQTDFGNQTVKGQQSEFRAQGKTQAMQMVIKRQFPADEKFREFYKWATFFYKTTGTTLYKQTMSTNKFWAAFAKCIFYLGLINANAILLGELVNIVRCLHAGHYVEAIMTLAYAGFTGMSSFKMLWYLWWKQDDFNKLLVTMQELFPATVADAAAFKLERYLRQCSWITAGYSLLYMLLIWVYNLYPLVLDWLYQRWWHNGDFTGGQLPYSAYIPWQWQGSWTWYALLYASQCWGGYVSAVGQLTGDLVVCATITKIIMYYDYVANTIELLEVKTDEFNSEKLKSLIMFHQRVLGVSDQANKIFGLPLFFTCSSSSFLICFLGFQLATGEVQVDLFIKLMLFLISCISQMYLVCYYGQAHRDASTNIGLSVYKNDWTHTPERHKKMLLLIILRASKPSVLKATFLLSVSQNTMTSLLQLSYRFFAVLRTICE